jgi:hypothetical protein
MGSIRDEEVANAVWMRPDGSRAANALASLKVKKRPGIVGCLGCKAPPGRVATDHDAHTDAFAGMHHGIGLDGRRT